MSRTEPVHLLDDLRELKLPAFAEHWSRVADEVKRNRGTHADYLADLAHLEVNGRQERRVARRIKEARFPILKTLDAFDFAAQPDLDKDAVLELASCDFVDDRANAVLLGGVGTGKTHLAIALGMACCQQGRRVRFLTAAELTTALVEAKAADRLSRKLEHFARFEFRTPDIHSKNPGFSGSVPSPHLPSAAQAWRVFSVPEDWVALKTKDLRRRRTRWTQSDTPRVHQEFWSW